MLLRRLTWSLVALLFLPAATAAGRRAQVTPPSLVQATESDGRTFLRTVGGRTTLVSDRASTRVPLRRGERLFDVAEAGRGWVAAGIHTRGERTTVVVVREANAGFERLPGPVRPADLHRTSPRVLVGKNRLTGVAWLEGQQADRMEVRVAEWTGTGWSSPTTVSPAGPGSQTGLSQTVLADGTQLLAWSRWDGQDLEIYWSRSQETDWTRPRPIEAADGVPDVTPTLIRHGNGALVAWSEFAGDVYRLRFARFDGQDWRPLAGTLRPEGVQPRFYRLKDEPMVLFRTGRPRGWAVFSPSGGPGRPSRFAHIETERSTRPLVGLRGDTGPVLEWNEESSIPARWEVSP